MNIEDKIEIERCVTGIKNTLYGERGYIPEKALFLLSEILDILPVRLYSEIPELEALYRKLKKDAQPVAQEYFPVLRTCKEDMKEEFEASPELRQRIEQFTDEQMKNISLRVGEDLTEHYWEAIREEVEVELMETTIAVVKCKGCGRMWDMNGCPVSGAGPYDIADFVCDSCLKQGVKR